MIKQLLHYFLVVMMSLSTIHADVPKILSTLDDSSTPLFSAIQEREEQYKNINEKIQQFTMQLPVLLQKLHADTTLNHEQILRLELELSKEDNEKYVQELALYKEIDQVLKDTSQMYDDINIIMYDYKKILEKSIQDSNFQMFKKEYKLQNKSQFTFHDLLVLYQTIQSLELRVTHLSDQKKNIETELETYNRGAKTTKKLHVELETQLQKLDEKLQITRDEVLEHEEKLVRLKIILSQFRTQLNNLKIEYFEYKVRVVVQQLFVLKTQVHMLRQHVQNIKYNIHVTERDLANVQEKLNNDKTKAFAQKDSLRLKREEILKEKSVHEHMLEQTSISYKIEPMQEEDWGKEIDDTPIAERHFVEVGWLSAHVRMLEISRQLVESSLILIDTKIEHDSTLFSAMEIFNRMMTRRFLNENKMLEEKKKYEEIKAATKIKITLYSEKIDAFTKELNRRKKIHDFMKILDQRIAAQKALVFHDNNALYEEVRYYIRIATEEEKKYTETLAKLSENYTSVIVELENISRLAGFIINELRASSIWYRPAYAVTLHGLSRAVPEIVEFFRDITLYVRYSGLMHFAKKFIAEINSFLLFLIFLLKILFFLVLAYFFCRFASRFHVYLFEKSRYKAQSFRRFLLLISVASQLIYNHIYSISFITILFICASVLSDVYIFTVLYLLLIPYSVVLMWSFIKLFVLNNKEYDYILVPQELLYQFASTLFFLCCTTMSIMLFRQAFMLSGLFIDSEVPTILLALNFILLQLSLIFLISKEHITEILPEGSEFWQGVRSLIDTYFYFILFCISAVIVMSNPYIGFGRLVLYVLVRIVYITLIFRLILFLHSLVKTGSSHLLFAQEAGIIKERFEHAKTFFGFVMIVSFLLFCFIGGIIIAKICGWPIALRDIYLLFYEPIMFAGTSHPITPLSILQIVGFVLIGFLFSYALEQFVFAKIFDLLLIEVGIQHTIIRITQYVVVIIAVFIGFQNVGLEKIIGYAFTALALSIGWYIKEPISDFFAYFIILVQRTIKIGDFIRIEGEIEGVVRKITPRSVMLRRKNSTTLLIPNSLVVQKVVANWNYIRSFVAFDDIRIAIQYHEDPSRVRSILLQVLNNHPRILKTPKPIVFLDQFGDHGYVFMIRGFISSTYTLDMWEIASEVRLNIIQALRENNVHIAIPVRFITESPLILQKNGAVVKESAEIIATQENDQQKT